jgi:hypothetical protein
MEEAEKEFVREYNAAIKHGDSTEKVNMPHGISVKNKVQRTKGKEGEASETKPKGLERKIKGVVFGISDTDHNETHDE